MLWTVWRRLGRTARAVQSSRLPVRIAWSSSKALVLSAQGLPAVSMAALRTSLLMGPGLLQGSIAPWVLSAQRAPLFARERRIRRMLQGSRREPESGWLDEMWDDSAWETPKTDGILLC